MESDAKRLKFSPELIPLIMSGEKTSTWRLWDDKELKENDVIEVIESGTHKTFGIFRLIKVVEKKMGDLTEEDKTGHEKFKSDKDMYETYSSYYSREVNSETPVKIIWFQKA